MTVEITKEDVTNIRKWIATAKMAIEAKQRKPFIESELRTMNKLQKIEYKY